MTLEFTGAPTVAWPAGTGSPSPAELTAADLLVLGAGPAGVGRRLPRGRARATGWRWSSAATGVGGAAAQPRGRRGARRPRQPPPAPLHRAADPGRAAGAAGRRPAAAAAQRAHPAGRPLDRLPAAPARPAAAAAAGDGRRRRARRGPRARCAAAARGHLRGGAARRARAHALRALLLPLRAQDLGPGSGRARRRAGPPARGRRARPGGMRGARVWRAGRGQARASSTRAAATGSCGRRWPTPARAAGADVVLGAAATPPRALAGRARVAGLADGRDDRGAAGLVDHPAHRAGADGPPGARARGARRRRGRCASGRWCSSTWCCERPPLQPLRRPLPARRRARRSRGCRSRTNYRDGDDPRGPHRAVRRDPVRRRRRALAPRATTSSAAWRPTGSSRPGCRAPSAAEVRGRAPARTPIPSCAPATAAASPRSTPGPPPSPPC